MKVLSADDHVVEPADLWTQRLQRSHWGEKVPHVARQADGAERWVVEGQTRTSTSLVPTRALSAERHVEPQRWSEVPKEAYDPQQRLKAMDRDGVDVQVLYPLASGVGGEVLAGIRDASLQMACVEAYNDWVMDVWAKASPRFVPQCLAPLLSVEGAVKEVRRAVQRGHRGVVVPGTPWQLGNGVPHFSLPVWDPFLAAIQDLDVPFCVHAGSAAGLLLDIMPNLNLPTARAFDSYRQTASGAALLGGWLMTGILNRFPRLQVVFSASSVDYVPFCLEACDHQWERQQMAIHDGFQIRPSEVFKRQCYVTTWIDQVGLQVRRYVGVDRILWESEFPMNTSTWPESAQAIQRNFQGVPQGEREMILWRNAAQLYKVLA